MATLPASATTPFMKQLYLFIDEKSEQCLLYGDCPAVDVHPAITKACPILGILPFPVDTKCTCSVFVIFYIFPLTQT